MPKLSWDDYSDENTAVVEQAPHKAANADSNPALMLNTAENQTQTPKQKFHPEQQTDAIKLSSLNGKNNEDDDDGGSITSNGSAGGVVGLEHKMTAERIQVDDKRIINCRADLNQLVPFKYNWAWEKYLAGCANHWMPNEINMSADISLWRDPNGLTEDERLIIMRNLGFLFNGRFFSGQ